MNNERYHIQEFPPEGELSDDSLSTNVSPFPVRRWRSPLPIGVEGTPVATHLQKELEKDTKSLTRFYPPLLVFSTMLTGVFFFLYLSKPVVVAESNGSARENSQNLSSGDGESVLITPSAVDELVPWPVDDELLKAKKPVAPAPIFPDRLPTSNPAAAEVTSVEPAREIVVIPFFQATTEIELNSVAEAEAELIRDAILKNREAAEELRVKSAALASQWDSLIESAQSESLSEDAIEE